MAKIKVGDREIPVIDFVEFTGDPSAPSWNAILNLIYAKGWTAKSLFQAGWNIASKYSDARAVQENRYSVGHIGGGRTGLGDNSEMVVSIDQTVDPQNTMNRTEIMHLNFTRQNGQVAESLYNQQDWTLCTMWGSTWPASQQHTETNVVAIKFLYPNATEPEYRVASYALGFIQNGITSTSDSYNVVTSALFIPIAYINKTKGTALDYEGEPEPPEEPFDPSEPEPYDPHGDDTSDDINVPTDPPIGLTNVGFINVYKTALNALRGLGEYIFPDPQALTASDVLTALIKICQTLTDVNLINYVIDCHIIPYTPHISGQSTIKVGYRDTGITADVVDQDYVTVACGSLNIGEYFSGFQDYLLTKSKLYLPFIGFVDMKPEFWQAGTLTVDYKFNVIDGSFMCYIRSTSSKSQLHASVIAQYAGNACYHIPITGMSYAQLAAGFVGAGASIASSGGSVAGVLGSATSALNTMASSKDMQQSNGYSASAAMMGIRKPYLMIERPRPAYPANYPHDKGYPSNITTALSNVHGFTVISDIDLSGIPLTDAELNDIRALLSEGVYF